MITGLIKRYRNRKRIAELRRKIKSWQDYRDHCSSAAIRAEAFGDRARYQYLMSHAVESDERIYELRQEILELL